MRDQPLWQLQAGVGVGLSRKSKGRLHFGNAAATGANSKESLLRSQALRHIEEGRQFSRKRGAVNEVPTRLPLGLGVTPYSF